MPRNAASYRDASTYCVQFLGDLADAPHTHSVRTNPSTRAEAMRFRKQLYKWRFLLKQALGDPANAEHRAATEWLTPIVGARRATRDWLDLIIFQVEPNAQGAFVVRATVQPPIIGIDPFAAPAGVDEAAAMIRRATND